MVKKRMKRRGRLVKRLSQTGKRKSVKRDMKRKAMGAGRRISRTGRKYTETRRNRSDKKGLRL